MKSGFSWDNIYEQRVTLMNVRFVLPSVFILLCGQALLLAQGKLEQNSLYSTCPEAEQAAMRNVAYVVVSEPQLRKWATVKPNPLASDKPEPISVLVEVEGERVFCASALNGPAQKQRAAVDTIMLWKFKKDRGDFKDDVIGTITIRF
jgi:hypothetical protein